MGNQQRFQRLQISGTLCALLLAMTASIPHTQAQGVAPYEQRYDLTANAVIDGSDASVASGSWSDLQSGDACAMGALKAADVTGDGCMDVGDVQRIAERIGGAAPARSSLAQAGELATWVVTSGNDDPDSAPGDGVCKIASTSRCTLRAAIEEANLHAGPDRITFDVRNSNGSCPAVVNIYPDSAVRGMLTLDDASGAGTTIDGYTQCGAQANTGDIAGNAVIKIDLRGRYQRNVHGLRLLSPNNVLRGLAVFNWDRQVEIYGGRARYNQLEGNFIGTDASETFTATNMGTHHSEGLRIQIGAHHNIVGCGSFDANDSFVPCTDQAQINAARNLVAGNGNDGIHLELDTTYNRIVGNYVGLKQDGATALRNWADGVDFEAGPQYNWLGGETPAERNVISGNGSEGIEVSHNTGTQFNRLVGNYFGLDATGMKGVENLGNGISFEDTVDSNYAYNNIVSGNHLNGFRFYIMATRNVVSNNIVGLNAAGQPLPNKSSNGVYVMGGSSHNIISENIIANHPDAGVYLSNESDADHNGFGTTFYNTISKNSMYNNGREGILFGSKKGVFANEDLAAPTLTDVNTLRVSGTACAGCTIEVFIADKLQLTRDGADESGEGRTFLGAGSADSAGAFSFGISQVPLDTILTATATDAKGNTSMFARNVMVTTVGVNEPTPVPTDAPTAIPADPTATPEVPTPTATATAEPAPAGRPVIWLPVVIKEVGP